MTDTPSPSDPTPHRRRPRYRGTHPRHYKQKYKELDPERYPDEVEKAVERGGTPAGSHIPVMPDEVVAALAPSPGDTLVDCTLGHGGHAELLARLVAPGGRIIGLDRDAEELARTEARLAPLELPIVARHANHSALAKVLRELEVNTVDGLLADLGCSSMQLDQPDRGFSFKRDGPLDLRMDRSHGATAAEWLSDKDEDAIAAILSQHGDEPYAVAIARGIVRNRAAGKSLTTTGDLVALVLAAKDIEGRRFKRPDPYTAHPAARTFQALRIVVNREKEHLRAFLRDMPWVVRPGGRIAILTFHQGEESEVVKALQAGVEQGLWNAEALTPTRPTREETRRNPRSRSARLFTATRSES